MDRHDFDARQVLEAVLARPSMCVGNTPHLFTAAISYLQGIDNGLGLAGSVDSLFPSDFEKRMRSQLNFHHPTKGWREELLERCGGDEEKAFEAYRDLAIEYLQDHSDT
jgi:hypothetical protein